jgi:hypothetical protein
VVGTLDKAVAVPRGGAAALTGRRSGGTDGIDGRHLRRSGGTEEDTTARHGLPNRGDGDFGPELSERWRGGQGLGSRLSGRAHEARRAVGVGQPVGTTALYPRQWRRAAPPRSANRSAKMATAQLTDGPHATEIFQFQKTSKITFPHKKNRYKVRKNLRKFMEVRNDTWNTFHQ